MANIRKEDLDDRNLAALNRYLDGLENRIKQAEGSAGPVRFGSEFTAERASVSRWKDSTGSDSDVVTFGNLRKFLGSTGYATQESVVPLIRQYSPDGVPADAADITSLTVVNTAGECPLYTRDVPVKGSVTLNWVASIDATTIKFWKTWTASTVTASPADNTFVESHAAINAAQTINWFEEVPTVASKLWIRAASSNGVTWPTPTTASPQVNLVFNPQGPPDDVTGFYVEDNGSGGCPEYRVDSGGIEKGRATFHWTASSSVDASVVNIWSAWGGGATPDVEDYTQLLSAPNDALTTEIWIEKPTTTDTLFFKAVVAGNGYWPTPETTSPTDTLSFSSWGGAPEQVTSASNFTITANQRTRGLYEDFKTSGQLWDEIYVTYPTTFSNVTLAKAYKYIGASAPANATDWKFTGIATYPKQVEWWESVPESGATMWVKLVMSNDAYNDPTPNSGLGTLAASKAHTISGWNTIAANAVTNCAVSIDSPPYPINSIGQPYAVPVFTWTNPVSDINCHKVAMFVRLTNSSGSPAPTKDGTYTYVGDIPNTQQNATIVALPGWAIPDQTSTYKTWEFIAVAYAQNDTTTVQTSAWSSGTAAYYRLTPSDPGTPAIKTSFTANGITVNITGAAWTDPSGGTSYAGMSVVNSTVTSTGSIFTTLFNWQQYSSTVFAASAMVPMVDYLGAARVYGLKEVMSANGNIGVYMAGGYRPFGGGGATTSPQLVVNNYPGTVSAAIVSGDGTIKLRDSSDSLRIDLDGPTSSLLLYSSSSTVTLSASGYFRVPSTGVFLHGTTTLVNTSAEWVGSGVVMPAGNCAALYFSAYDSGWYDGDTGTVTAGSNVLTIKGGIITNIA